MSHTIYYQSMFAHLTGNDWVCKYRGEDEAEAKRVEGELKSKGFKTLHRLEETRT